MIKLNTYHICCIKYAIIRDVNKHVWICFIPTSWLLLYKEKIIKDFDK